jgi:hypothetical protein
MRVAAAALDQGVCVADSSAVHTLYDRILSERHGDGGEGAVAGVQ